MKEKQLLWIILFNLTIIISEVIFGVISNSFVLIADALHNTGDIISIVITLIALKLGKRPKSFKYTFGFLKAEMMAAFVNTLFLSLTMIYLIVEAIQNFLQPEIIESKYMIIVGIIAIMANGLSAFVLKKMGETSCSSHNHSHNNHEDANIKSAYLHMLADTLISVGVVVAGIVIYYYQIYFLDSILTIIFSIYIIFHSYPLLEKSFLSLLDANLLSITEEELKKIIEEDKRVVQYNDLHIYQPSSTDSFISFHLILDSNGYTLKECEIIAKNIKAQLEKLGFNHILIELDTI